MIFGAAPPVLAFLDTLDFGVGEFDIATNGLIIVLMAGIYGFTVVMNIINFGAEKNWHQAMITYNATELRANEDYVNDPNAKNNDAEEEVVEEDEGEWLMNDQDWSW